MRLAWFTPYIPFPRNSGGRIRMAELAGAFHTRDVLHLYACRAQDDVRLSETELNRSVEPFQRVAMEDSYETFPNPFSGVPHLVRCFPAGLKQRFLEEHRRNPYDAIVHEHCYTHACFDKVDGPLVVVDEHNIESRYYASVRSGRPWKLAAAREHQRFRSFERHVWRAADVVTAVSDDDASVIRQVRPDSGVVIPNGVSVDKYRFIPPSARQGNRILFVGTLSYSPNIQAARLLAKEILPLVRQRIPDATLTLAGRDPAPLVEALASEFVQVTGTVPNVASLFDEHAAYAMPISLGAGSCLKALEPLASGVPLVASAFAVRGFQLEAGEHYVQADGCREVADALARVLTSRASYDSMAEKGRARAANYDWKVIGDQFVEVVTQAVLEKRRKGQSAQEPHPLALTRPPFDSKSQLPATKLETGDTFDPV